MTGANSLAIVHVQHKLHFSLRTHKYKGEQNQKVLKLGLSVPSPDTANKINPTAYQEQKAIFHLLFFPVQYTLEY